MDKNSSSKTWFLGHSAFWAFLGGIVISGCVWFFFNNNSPLNRIDIPQSSCYIKHDNYKVLYDLRMRTPIWVLSSISSPYDTLTQNSPSSITSRKIAQFLEINETDYASSGFIPGQLALIENSSKSNYFYSCVPLTSEFVNGNWKNFKIHLQQQLKDAFQCVEIDVLIGPLFLPKQNSQLVEYKIIGDSQIAVPTHLFVVINFCANGETSLLYIIPTSNQPNSSFESFKVNSSEFEKISGLIVSDNNTGPRLRLAPGP